MVLKWEVPFFNFSIFHCIHVCVYTLHIWIEKPYLDRWFPLNSSFFLSSMSFWPEYYVLDFLIPMECIYLLNVALTFSGFRALSLNLESVESVDHTIAVLKHHLIRKFGVKIVSSLLWEIFFFCFSG